MRNKVAGVIAAAAAIGAGAAVLAALLSVATWGGPNGGPDAGSDLPFGLLLTFALVAIAFATPVGLVVYALLRRRP